MNGPEESLSVITRRPEEPASSGGDGPNRPGVLPRTFLRRFFARVCTSFLIALLAPLVLAFLWLRIFGLPNSVKDSLLHEIERRHVFPFPVAVDRFRLSASGAILADGLVVYRDAARQSVMLRVDKARVSVAWFSWWRGTGLVDGASISNADVQYPIGPETTADFQDVNADVAISGHDIKIENAQARLLNLSLSVRGTIHNDGFPKAKPPTADQLREREAIWRSVLKALADVGTARPIDVDLEFETATHDLGGGRANFSLDSRDLTWRTAPIEEFSLHGSLSEGVVDLNDFKIALERGELTAYGEWNIAERSAELQFTSSADFTSLAPGFTGALGQALRRLDFPNNPPGISGRVLFDLHQGVHTDIQADLDWRDFSFNGVPFSRLTVPLAYDGPRLLIPGLRIVGDAGNVDLELFFDSTRTPRSLNAKITSNLDPTILKGVLGEGMDRFLNSCAFPGGGPQIEATATGSDLKTDAWTITGKMTTGKFVYKSAAFDSASSDFTFANSKLSLPDLSVQRPEGKGGGEIIYDFKNRAVELHNLVTQVDVAAVAPIMGPKFTEYTKPYQFARAPIVRANGKVDLQDQKKDLDTDLLVDVQAQSPMGWTLFHVPFTFGNPVGTLVFKNRKLTINMKQCGFYDGGLTGVLDMDLSQNPAGYDVNLKLAKVNFQKFMIRVFNYQKSTGQLTANCHLTGSLGKLETMNGGGEVKVENGDITAIPLLGSLTPLIPLLSDADAAHAHFTAENGVIHTQDLHISSETLALIGNGTYNFLDDQVDLNMRVNANLLFSIPLYPLSKIFEFHGTGHMKDVKWVPRNF
jgi:hypothetical protein